MNETLKALLTNGRMITLFLFLIFAIVAINPQFGTEGVAIRNVIQNSSAAQAGIVSPSPRATPVSREVITVVNGMPIKSVQDYENAIANLQINQSFTIESSGGYYRLIAQPNIIAVPQNYTRNVTFNQTDGNTTIILRKEEPVVEHIVDGVADIGLRVYPAPVTNLRKGLDLQGGTRVLLQPEEAVDSADMDLLVANMQQRLNVFGLSDVVVKQTVDLQGNQFVLVEIAGANEEEVKNLVAKQGKFEARIANQTVFRGGDDITYVCRTAQCAGIDPNYGCQGDVGSFACRFQFQISLSPEAAQRQAEATAGLEVVGDSSGRYLSEPIVLFLDDSEVDSLQIADSLRGRPVTDISISGSGSGANQQEAIENSLTNMKRLQTILITGSLPVKLSIVETSAMSPVLGESFLKNALLMSALSILSVAVVVFIRYRLLSVAIPMVITMVCEVTLLLGFAALVGWNLDLAAIAGILIAIGTGVDDQIVISDETIRNEQSSGSWAQQLKKAFFIIFAAYATTMVAMAPLLFAGAGLLKGFALTTMAGVTFGVLITRPAFAAMVKILLKR